MVFRISKIYRNNSEIYFQRTEGRFKGPCRVIQILRDNCYIITDTANYQTIIINQKLYYKTLKIKFVMKSLMDGKGSYENTKKLYFD